MIYLSYGAGVQSTAMLLMSSKGLLGCPRADVAIFADTGDEPAWVYETLEYAKTWSSIPIITVRWSTGGLEADLREKLAGGGKRLAALPIFTPSDDGREAMGRRQCTREYKIQPIERKVRELIGVEPGKRVPRGVSVTCLIGISTDEATRMKPNLRPWITNDWPLCNARMNRSQCEKLLEEHGIPVPYKSSCRYCPYHSNAYWRKMRDDYPDDWAKAVAFDAVIRNSSAQGYKRPCYVHRQLVPLDEVNLNDDQMELFENECEGICGV